MANYTTPQANITRFNRVAPPVEAIQLESLKRNKKDKLATDFGQAWILANDGPDIFLSAIVTNKSGSAYFLKVYDLSYEDDLGSDISDLANHLPEIVVPLQTTNFVSLDFVKGWPCFKGLILSVETTALQAGRALATAGDVKFSILHEVLDE